MSNDFNTDDFDFEGGEFDEIETLIMEDENGVETEFIIVDSLDHNGATFLLVVDMNSAEDDEADAILLKQVGEDEANYSYEEPTDEEFEEIARILNERSDEYDIEI